jgi:hypothetical protein
MRHQHVQTRQVADDALTRAAEALGDDEGSAGIIVSSGTTTLVAGVGPAVALPSITARSTVLYDLGAANASTALGSPQANITPGVGFTTTSISITAPPATQAGDASTYRYIVVNST